MRDILSFLTPDSVFVILIGIIVSIVCSIFIVYDCFKKHQEQHTQWFRRPLTFMGIGLLILVFSIMINTIVLALTLHGYLSHSIYSFISFIGILSVLLFFSVLVYASLLLIWRKKE